MIDFKNLKKETFKGFTLIELLVVIAIIAILAAILFPVFAQAREKARQSTCLSNLKQIGTAVLMYTDDYDETYPIAYDGTAAYPLKCYWIGMLNPYVKNYRLFYCPSSYATYNSKASESDQLLGAMFANYTVNQAIWGNYPDLTTAPVVKVASVKAPADSVIVYEGSAWCLSDASWANTGAYSCWLPGAYLGNGNLAFGGPSVGLSDYKNGRHNQGINLTYCDGHAKFKKSTEVYSWMNTTSNNPMRYWTW